MKCKFFLFVLQFLDRFFTDPDFSGSDPKFWPMDPDSGKKADLDPEKNPNAKHCINSIISLFLPN